MIAFRLVVLSGPDAGAIFDVPADGATLGRGATATIKLNDPAVSRAHGAIARHEVGLVWCDDSARHPALLDGAPADGKPLRPGHELVIGRTRMLVLAPDRGLALLDERAGATAELSMTELGDKRDRPSLALLVALADVLVGARDRAALAEAAARLLCDRLRADRVDVVLAAAPHEPLATHARGAARDLARIPRTLVERVLATGNAIAFDEAGQPALLVGFAPAGTGMLGGFVHIVRAAPFGDVDTEMALVAVRMLAGFVTARSEHDTALRRARALVERTGGGPRILGDSRAAAAVRAFVGKVAATDSTVLLLGESGTGKELVAAAIHDASPRSAGPFVAVNCASLGEALLESELFGHERGAFTGASERKPGKFELAEGGTLLLDEIGELPARSQAKLLRALEDRRVERIGGVRPIAVDVRVLAATNRDLEAMIRAGEFRGDLYFRIGVISVRLPALRERTADVGALAAHFLDQLRGRAARTIEGFTPAALAALASHPWPGNIRELRNAIERAVVLGEHAWIEPDELFAAAAPAPAGKGSVRDAERETIAAAMTAAAGNKVKAAATLGIDRTTLYRKLRAYGLD
jgi:Nif-specific regulatory protein